MFKVGDIVKCIQDFGYQNTPIKDKCYKVVSVNFNSTYFNDYIGIDIRSDWPLSHYNNNVMSGKEANWGFFCFELATIEEANKYNFPDKLESLLNE